MIGGAGHAGMTPLRGDDFARNITALLVLAPHPDDEVLGCGWLMRAVIGYGGRVIVVWLTDGDASHGPTADVAALTARRQCEAAAGLAALGIVPEATYRLGARDGYLADFATSQANAAWLQAICTRHAVDTLAVTAGDDGHPDHRAAFALAQCLSVPRRLAYPVSVRYDGGLAEAPANALAIGPYDDPAKRRALACHASQSEAGGALFPLSADAIARFSGEAEIFYPFAAQA